MPPESAPTDPKAVLEQLNRLNLESDEVPDFVQAQDAGQETDETKKKAARAWHDLRGMLKVAKGTIEELSKEKEQKPPAPAAAQTPSSDSDRSSQQKLYFAGLRSRAMANAGVYDPDNPIVQLEVNRLYQEDMARMAQTQRAQTEGDKIFNSTVEQFKQLDDKDKEAIKSRMAGLDPIQRANPETIKVFVHTYLGENLEKFAKPPKLKGDAAQAAASTVKARGGVGAGNFSPGSGSPSTEKPPTPEELAEMNKLKIPPDRVDLYRRAKAKAANYAPR